MNFKTNLFVVECTHELTGDPIDRFEDPAANCVLETKRRIYSIGDTWILHIEQVDQTRSRNFARKTRGRIHRPIWSDVVGHFGPALNQIK